MSNTAQQESRVDFDKAKERSVLDFLEQALNVPAKKVGSGWRMGACPSCGEGGKQSVRVSINPDERTWKCHACNAGGSVIDAAMKVWNCSALEAAMKLTGETMEFRHAQPKRDPAKVKAQDEAKKRVMQTAFLRLQQLTKKHADEPEPLAYLTEVRKIRVKWVREAQSRGMVGFLPNRPGLVKRLLIEELGEDLLRESKLWRPDSKLPGIAYRPLVFFAPGLASAEFRIIQHPAPEGATKSIQYGSPEYPYWWQGKDGCGQLLVVEGMIDCLSAVELGWEGHIMAVTGCRKWTAEWFERAASRYALKRVVVAFDNDVDNPNNPGQQAAGALKEALESKGIPCCIRSPEVGDINDILRNKRG